MILIRLLLLIVVTTSPCMVIGACRAAQLPSMMPAVLSRGVPANSAAPLLAQSSWPSDRYGQQTANREVRFRAKSVIRLGIFVAAFVAGIITYIVRLASGGKNDERNYRHHLRQPAGGSGPGSASVANAAEVTAGLPPVRSGAAPPIPPAKPVPSEKPLPAGSVPPAKSNNGLALAIALSGFAVLLAVTGAAVLLFFAFKPTMPRPPDNSPFPTEQMEALVEQLRTSNEAASSDFEQRWEAAVQAGTFGDEESGPPSASAIDQTSGSTRSLFAELAPPEVSIPVIAWDKSDIVKSGMSITDRGMSFDDTAPDGGVLVGFRVTSGRHRLASIQPIYQLADQYVLGKLHGNESEEQVAQLLASPGDAVAAVRLDLGGRIEGLQAEFARISGGRLDLATKYTSPLFGREIANNAVVIESEGDVFVGIAGKIRDGIDGLFLQRHMAFGTCSVNQPPIPVTGTKTLSRAGGKAANEFQELAPEGGFLVGMRIFLGRSWGGAIQGVQPIYQIGSDYRLGDRYGADGGLAHQVLARPGYAVGKIEARAGLVLNSVKLTFQHINDGSLDPRDAYDSNRFGSPGGGPFALDSAGQFMVGVGGSFHDDMVSLETIVAQP